MRAPPTDRTRGRPPPPLPDPRVWQHSPQDLPGRIGSSPQRAPSTPAISTGRAPDQRGDERPFAFPPRGPTLRLVRETGSVGPLAGVEGDVPRKFSAIHTCEGFMPCDSVWTELGHAAGALWLGRPTRI